LKTTQTENPPKLFGGLYRNQVEAAGIETGPKSSENHAVGDQSGAESGALGVKNALARLPGNGASDQQCAPGIPKTVDAELLTVIDAWPDLPPLAKAGILAMVRSIR
jgi:hypothetical protein